MADKPKRTRGTPAPDDADLFESVMRDVRRAGGAPPAPGAVTPPPDLAPEEPAPAAATPPRKPAAVKRTFYAPIGPGETGDVDRRSLDRLKRGQVRPEARIDLHGMTQEQAHGALAGFIARAQAEGRRCVLVVTGKGSVAAGGGVLRNALPGWLNAAQLRPRVIAYSEAVPRDGGAGAVYVLLRRIRPGGGP